MIYPTLIECFSFAKANLFPYYIMLGIIPIWICNGLEFTPTILKRNLVMISYITWANLPRLAFVRNYRHRVHIGNPTLIDEVGFDITFVVSLFRIYRIFRYHYKQQTDFLYCLYILGEMFHSGISFMLGFRSLWSSELFMLAYFGEVPLGSPWGCYVFLLPHLLWFLFYNFEKDPNKPFIYDPFVPYVKAEDKSTEETAPKEETFKESSKDNHTKPLWRNW